MPTTLPPHSSGTGESTLSGVARSGPCAMKRTGQSFRLERSHHLLHLVFLCRTGEKLFIDIPYYGGLHSKRLRILSQPPNMLESGLEFMNLCSSNGGSCYRLSNLRMTQVDTSSDNCHPEWQMPTDSWLEHIPPWGQKS